MAMVAVKQKEQASSKSYGSLTSRLQYHRYLQSAADLAGRSFGVIYSTVCLAAAILLGLHLPISPLFIIACMMVPLIITLWLSALWSRNIDCLTTFDDVAVVGPLLDAVETRSIQSQRSHRKRESSVWAEHLLLHHLPPLLGRLGAGDGPDLSPRQRATLQRIVDSPDYYNFFTLPGLRDKIDAVLNGH